MLDIGALKMMPQVDQDLCLVSESSAESIRHAPIGNIGMVERRLKGLIFHQHRLLRRQRGVDFRQPLGKPLLALADMALTGEIGAVRKPKREILRADGLHDLHALTDVCNGPRPNFRARTSQAAKAIVIILEDVRIDCPDRHPQRSGIL